MEEALQDRVTITTGSAIFESPGPTILASYLPPACFADATGNGASIALTFALSCWRHGEMLRIELVSKIGFETLFGDGQV
jgi:hypothetical protein